MRGGNANAASGSIAYGKVKSLLVPARRRGLTVLSSKVTLLSEFVCILTSVVHKNRSGTSNPLSFAF